MLGAILVTTPPRAVDEATAMSGNTDGGAEDDALACRLVAERRREMNDAEMAAMKQIMAQREAGTLGPYRAL